MTSSAVVVMVSTLPSIAPGGMAAGSGPAPTVRTARRSRAGDHHLHDLGRIADREADRLRRPAQATMSTMAVVAAAAPVASNATGGPAGPAHSRANATTLSASRHRYASC